VYKSSSFVELEITSIISFGYDYRRESWQTRNPLRLLRTVICTEVPTIQLLILWLWGLVPGGGIEPPRAEARRILSPLRLPVPPSRLEEFYLSLVKSRNLLCGGDFVVAEAWHYMIIHHAYGLHERVADS
jgi:hypothetical protein